MRKIDKIIIHCSASNSAWYDFDLMKRDHMEARGWKDIGYHYGIDYKAQLHLLRPIKLPGAHCSNFNFSSIGVALLGNNYFSVDQFTTLAKLCNNLMQSFKLTKDNIYPHNHFNPDKTCPTFDVEWWKNNYLKE